MKHFLPLLAVVLTSCTTIRYTLNHSEKPIFWDQGISYVTRSENGISYSAGPGAIEFDGPQFHIQIENKSSLPITVGSSSFVLITTDRSVQAENPEEMIETINQDIARAKKAKDPLGINIIGTVANLGNFSKEGRERDQRELEKDQKLETELNEYNLQKEKIASRFLRQTTLKPGQTVSGIIQFKAHGEWKNRGQVVLLKTNGIRNSANTIPFVVDEK